MKYCYWIALFFLLSACKGNRKMSYIEVYNFSDTIRCDEEIVINKNLLYKNKDSEQSIVPVLTDANGRFIPSQYDDVDGDGRWDSFVFVCDLPSKSKTPFKLNWVNNKKVPVFVNRTNIRYGKMVSPGKIVELTTDMHSAENLPRDGDYPYQMDGPAWENDKVGFRHYFDGRNNRDVFGKLLSIMVLDTVGITDKGVPGNTYNVMSNWGRDILTIGSSLGLGGLAVLLPDTLIRLGVLAHDNKDNVDSTRYTLITKGPVRSIFKLNYYGWHLKGYKINVEETITIWAGKYGYESKITTSQLPPEARMVTGMVTLENKASKISKIHYGKYLSINTHDKQASWKDGYLGLSIVVPKINVDTLFQASDLNSNIKDTWCIALVPDKKGCYHYNAYAGWEMSDRRFRNRTFYLEMINRYIYQKCNPVEFKATDNRK